MCQEPPWARFKAKYRFRHCHGVHTVSLEVFNYSPQLLKAGIVATALFQRFMEFSMYNHMCIIGGTLVAFSVCVVIPFVPPV